MARGETGVNLLEVYGKAVAASDAGLMPAALAPSATGTGLSISSAIMAASTNATSVKGSAGRLYAVEVFNNGSGIGYLKIYDDSIAPTAGSGTPVIRVMVPANAGSGAGVVRSYENGVTFSSGLGYTFTGAIGDSDTTAVSTSQFIVNLYYK